LAELIAGINKVFVANILAPQAVAAEHGTHIGDIDDQSVRIKPGDKGCRGIVLYYHGILDLRSV